MKIFATIAASYIALVAAEEAAAETTAAPSYTDSMSQTMALAADGKTYGNVSWYTRFYPMKDGAENVSEVHYACSPMMEGNVGFTWADYHDKEIFCHIATVTTPQTQNQADWCSARIRTKTNDDKYDNLEIKDGKLNNFNSRGANDKWNIEGEGKNSCMWETPEAVLNRNGTTFSPSINFYKATGTSDTEDNLLLLGTNYTAYWKIKDKDAEVKGMFEGLYLDDPMNPTLSGAKAVFAGVATAAALTFATLA